MRWWLFPGINLHSRLRYHHLPHYFGIGAPESPLTILDAGSGNGMLAYKAYLRGNRVIGVSFKNSEVEKARDLFNSYLQIDEDLLEFRKGNLYEIDFPARSFDEVICSEVLEHLLRDEYVCRKFYRWLKPGGVLHLCAPNAEHPYNASFPLDEKESGGHVRPGYTMDSYQRLLEPIGFRIEQGRGLGGPVRQWFNARIKSLQRRFGPAAGVPVFLLSALFLPFDSARVERARPFSLYVRAVKP